MFPLSDSSEATLGSQRKPQKIQLPILPSRAQVISNNSNKSHTHPSFTGSQLALRKSSLEARNPDLDSDAAGSRVCAGYDRCYRHASRKSWRFDRCHQEGRTPFVLPFQGIRSVSSCLAALLRAEIISIGTSVSRKSKKFKTVEDQAHPPTCACASWL